MFTHVSRKLIPTSLQLYVVIYDVIIAKGREKGKQRVGMKGLREGVATAHHVLGEGG